MLLIIFFTSCSSYHNSNWSDEDGYVIIQIDEIDPDVENYYAEITLESGRRIAVQLGKPDKQNQFRIENNFGKFTDVQIYTNKDIPQIKILLTKQDFFK